MPAFGFSLDLRSPAFGTPHTTLYREVLDMIAWGDSHGIDFVQLMEHHGMTDGYLPSPFVFATAIAARTTKMKVQLGAVLVPLQDPVKIAEDFAVVDLISGGRITVVLGGGYSRSEFAMFNKRLEDRAKALDEGTEIILRALSGERFEFGGREIFVRPLPVQEPAKAFLTGGGVPASVRRAIRFGLGMYPLNDETARQYAEACAAAGQAPGYIHREMGWVFISEDPERSWQQILRHVTHVVDSYVAIAKGATSSSVFEHVTTPEAARTSGIINVLTPDETVAWALEADRRGAVMRLVPTIGGIDPALGWEMLELYDSKVRPRLLAAAAKREDGK